MIINAIQDMFSGCIFFVTMVELWSDILNNKFVYSECILIKYGLIQSLFPITLLKLLKGESLPSSFALLQKNCQVLNFAEP